MLTALVLLYVGAVLAINGIWLIGQARVANREKVLRGRGQQEVAAELEAHPTFITGREVTMINLFTGFIGVASAVTLLVQGNGKADLASVRVSGFILLFAFTYLWVAANQYLNAGGHAFGWYCLFVAITAVPAGIYTLSNANGNTADIWLGVNWFAWAVLWFLFWVLLTLERPIAALAGWVALIEGIGTAWALGFAVLIAKFAF
jgi:putative amide transporter protein